MGEKTDKPGAHLMYLCGLCDCGANGRFLFLRNTASLLNKSLD